MDGGRPVADPPVPREKQHGRRREEEGGELDGPCRVAGPNASQVGTAQRPAGWVSDDIVGGGCMWMVGGEWCRGGCEGAASFNVRLSDSR